MKFLWLFDQDAVMITPLLTASLWALGGGGVLALRRFGVGAFLALSALSLGFPWYSALITAIIFPIVTALPYGDKVRGKLGLLYYPFLFVLGFLYGFSNFGLCLYLGRWLDLVAYSLCLGLLFSILTALSQSQAFKKIVPWKAVEIAVGGFIGFIAYKLY